MNPSDLIVGMTDPPDPLPSVRVVIPRPGQTVRGWILSDRPLRVAAHFVPQLGSCGRTQPHLATECPWCARGLPILVERYLSCWDARHGRHWIAHVTRGSLAGCPVLGDDQAVELRGLILVQTRRGEGPTGPVYAEVLQPRPGTPPVLPAPIDLLAALCRIWGGRGSGGGG